MSNVVFAPPVPRDHEHLRVLAIFHVVIGVLTILFSSIFIIHTVFGLMILLHPAALGPPKDQPPPVVGLLAFGIGSIVVLCGWILGVLSIYAGGCIKARRNYVFILVIDALLCAFTGPFGTILGVFSFIVLNRQTVKETFGRYYASEPLLNQDIERLNLLSTFHTVLGILLILTSLVSLIMSGIMFKAFFHHPAIVGGQNSNQFPIPPESFFYFYGGLIFFGNLLLGTLSILASKYLKTRRRHAFIMVTDTLLCLSMTPLGVALGVFTLTTMNQSNVKTLFASST